LQAAVAEVDLLPMVTEQVAVVLVAIVLLLHFQE
jgi:hypothetical protein